MCTLLPYAKLQVSHNFLEKNESPPFLQEHLYSSLYFCYNPAVLGMQSESLALAVGKSTGGRPRNRLYHMCEDSRPAARGLAIPLEAPSPCLQVW